jgi:serine/threonine-protein kinase
MAKIDRPTPFGRYELLRRIGAGGMGEVYLARLPGLGGADKVCVVKKILPHLSDDRGFVARFVDEGKVVIHLSHGNIAQVFEMGDVDGEYFMAMEYVEGKTLAKVESRLRERNQLMPVELTLLLGIKLLDGLAHAHKKADPTGRPLHVVHRDISPSNVMITYDGDLKIIDFGAALSTFKEEMTAPRVVIGNLSYMAPEHARKQHTDHRADLFSVGVVLWELLSWQLIPSDGDHVERWKRAARPNFEKPSKYRKEVSREIDALVMKALQTDARERFQDAESFRDELQIALARLSPTTTQRVLTEFMQNLFGSEHRAERKLIAEALGQPVPEESVAPVPSSSSSVKLAPPAPLKVGLGDASALEETDPEGARLRAVLVHDLQNPDELLSDPGYLSSPNSAEFTAPGAPPPPLPIKAPANNGADVPNGPATKSIRAVRAKPLETRSLLPESMRATTPGQPPIFGLEDEDTNAIPDVLGAIQQHQAALREQEREQERERKLSTSEPTPTPPEPEPLGKLTGDSSAKAEDDKSLEDEHKPTQVAMPALDLPPLPGERPPGERTSNPPRANRSRSRAPAPAPTTPTTFNLQSIMALLNGRYVWIAVGALVGFIVVVTLLSLSGRH